MTLEEYLNTAKFPLSYMIYTPPPPPDDALGGGVVYGRAQETYDQLRFFAESAEHRRIEAKAAQKVLLDFAAQAEKEKRAVEYRRNAKHMHAGSMIGYITIGSGLSFSNCGIIEAIVGSR